MVEKWRKLSPGERVRVQIVMGFLVLGLYGLTLYPFTRKQFVESGSMLHRRQNRIETRTETVALGGSANPQAIKRQLEEADKKLQGIKESFNELDTGFAPVDSSDMRQQLLLEISTLAQRTGVELVSVARKGLEGKSGSELLGSGRRNQPAETDAGPAAMDPELGRPLLLVNAMGQYQPLIAFLRGLKDLSFYVSPMQVRLSSRHLKDSGKGAGSGASVPMGEDDGSLNIFLELSM
jgi:hypothetical protein